MTDLYELGEHLGGGGYGDVYRALRRTDGATVAVKVLRDDIVDFRRRFEREVRFHQEYSHPAVMKVIDADLTVSPPYYVMPFYKNGTLKTRVGRVTGQEFLTFFETLLAVLVFLEERGAFHRDLKPDNILIDDEGQLVLSDFGAANDPAMTANFTRHGIGTPGYIAPELSRHRDGATPKCDIYSLGVTAFQLLTGIHPADAKSFDIADHLKTFPAEIREAILAMVDVEPTRRPDAKVLLGWLQRVKHNAMDAVVRKAKKALKAAPTPAWVIVGGVGLAVGVCAVAGYLIWKACQKNARWREQVAAVSAAPPATQAGAVSSDVAAAPEGSAGTEAPVVPMPSKADLEN